MIKKHYFFIAAFLSTSAILSSSGMAAPVSFPIKGTFHVDIPHEVKSVVKVIGMNQKGEWINLDTYSASFKDHPKGTEITYGTETVPDTIGRIEVALYVNTGTEDQHVCGTRIKYNSLQTMKSLSFTVDENGSCEWKAE